MMVRRFFGVLLALLFVSSSLLLFFSVFSYYVPVNCERSCLSSRQKVPFSGMVLFDGLDKRTYINTFWRSEKFSTCQVLHCLALFRVVYSTQENFSLLPNGE